MLGGPRKNKWTNYSQTDTRHEDSNTKIWGQNEGKLLDKYIKNLRTARNMKERITVAQCPLDNIFCFYSCICFVENKIRKNIVW